MTKNIFVSMTIILVLVSAFQNGTGTIKVQKQSQIPHNGQKLFSANCSPCHSTSNLQVVGPGLAGMTTKYQMTWILKWVHNSDSLIKSGDTTAVRVFNKYG